MALGHFLVSAIVFKLLLGVFIVQFLLIKRKPKTWYQDGVKINDEFLREPENWRFLYEKAQEMLIHYDNLNWQIGSILVGSNIVSMGLILQKDIESSLVFYVAIAGMISQFAWALWFSRHMALYNLRSDVLYAIETRLDIKHHRLPMECRVKKKRWLGLVSGHHVAVILSVGFSAVWLLITFSI